MLVGDLFSVQYLVTFPVTMQITREMLPFIASSMFLYMQ